MQVFLHCGDSCFWSFIWVPWVWKYPIQITSVPLYTMSCGSETQKTETVPQELDKKTWLTLRWSLVDWHSDGLWSHEVSSFSVHGVMSLFCRNNAKVMPFYEGCQLKMPHRDLFIPIIPFVQSPRQIMEIPFPVLESRHSFWGNLSCQEVMKLWYFSFQ